MKQTLIFQRSGESGTLALLSFEADSQLPAEAVVERLKSAVNAWVGGGGVDAGLLRYAGDDLNIGDLDSHGAFSIPEFQSCLVAAGLSNVGLLPVCGEVWSYDERLVDEDVVNRALAGVRRRSRP